MQKIKIDTLIIGAGPACMAAAMELSKAGKKFIIVEKQQQVGGLAKTYQFQEGKDIFRTDNGPHRFFSKHPYLYSFVEELLGEQWVQVKRQTRQFVDGKFYDYPINPVQALKNVGLLKATRMVIDYVIARIQFGIGVKKIENFEDYVVAHFGKTLGQFNMINYTEKIWGVKASTIHHDWAGQRINGLSVSALSKNLLHQLLKDKNQSKPRTLVDSFYYPATGSGLIYETIQKRLEACGYKFFLGADVTKILHEDGRCMEAHFTYNGQEYVVAFDNIVESIPIGAFLDLLSPAAPDKIKTARKRLKYRSQVYVFLTINKEHVTANQWIYFPSRQIPFARISEMKNFSKHMSPADKTSLFVEYFCTEADEVWAMPKKRLYEMTIRHLRKLGFIKDEEVRKYYILRQKDAYPIYDLEYKTYLSLIREFLDDFNNLYYIGRPGRFRYNNQDHSLAMGMLAAQSIIDGKKYDIEAVGSEEEWYEDGKIRRAA